LEQTPTDFVRYLYDRIDWNQRLIAITGARGTGKTTLLLQRILLSGLPEDETLYASLDHVYFARHGVLETAEKFVAEGGMYLFLDEVHKYPGWSREIKNVYDLFPELQIVLSGSSALHIQKGKADLSRRMLEWRLQGLSFREFLRLKYDLRLPVFSLDEIITDPLAAARQILSKIKPLKYLREYWHTGYYPFFTEGTGYYDEKLMQAVNEILETDLPAVTGMKYTAVVKLKKLLSVIADSVPYMPALTKLAKDLEVDRETVLKYLYHLEKAGLLMLLHREKKGMAALRKPEKVYLENPNLLYALSEHGPETGTMRETFFLNQIKQNHHATQTDKGDFLVDGRYLFQIGGKNKPPKQIKGKENAFLVLDDLELPYGNRLPLWLFGFLY